MASRRLVETTGAWHPDDTQSAVISLLAQGYSQQVAARMAGTSQQLISYWMTDAVFKDLFTARIREMAALFAENLEAVEDQQTVMATGTFHKALQGEIERDDSGNLPIEYLAAVELLRNTRWKQKAGGHKQFGAP